MAMIDLSRSTAIAAALEQIRPLLDGPESWRRWQPGDPFRMLDLSWTQHPSSDGPRWWGAKIVHLFGARLRDRSTGSVWERYPAPARSVDDESWPGYDPSAVETHDWFALGRFVRIRFLLEPQEDATLVTWQLTERVVWLQKLLLSAYLVTAEDALDRGLADLRALAEQR